MYREVELLTLKEWCTRYGIKIIEPKGFRNTKKNRVWNNKYTKGQFRRGLKRSYINVKTEKGLAFLSDVKVN